MNEFKVIRYVPGKPIAENGIYSGVPLDVYHSGKLCDGPSISSSGLRKIFTKSPLHYWINSTYNPLAIETEDTNAFALGRAAHLLFGGEGGFKKQFIVRDAKAPDGKAWNSTSGREWMADQAEKKLAVLTESDMEAIRGMAGLLPWQKNLTDSGLLNSMMMREHGLLTGLIEHTIAFKVPETGIWLLSRPDAIPSDSAIGADIKTTASEMDDNELDWTYTKLRYDMQAALCRTCFHGVTGLEMTNFIFIFVAKKEPFSVRGKEATEIDLDGAMLDNQAAFRAFAHGLKTGEWPGPGGKQTDASYIRNRRLEAATFRRQELMRDIEQ